jgi:hypothetical protein
MSPQPPLPPPSQGRLQQNLRSVTKNEVYRLFIREDVLHPLATALKSSLNYIFSSLMTSEEAAAATGAFFTPALPLVAVPQGGRQRRGSGGSGGSGGAGGGGAGVPPLPRSPVSSSPAAYSSSAPSTVQRPGRDVDDGALSGMDQSLPHDPGVCCVFPLSSSPYVLLSLPPYCWPLPPPLPPCPLLLHAPADGDYCSEDDDVISQDFKTSIPVRVRPPAVPVSSTSSAATSTTASSSSVSSGGIMALLHFGRRKDMASPPMAPRSIPSPEPPALPGDFVSDW